MPPPRCALPGLNMLDLGFPNQRAVGKKPRVWPTRMRGQEVLYDGVIILIDMVDPCWIWTCVLQYPMDPGHEIGCECHLPGTGYEPSRSRRFSSLT